MCSFSNKQTPELVYSLLQKILTTDKFCPTMASSIHVNTVCSSIHDFIQSSGLHFVINQTPWSSYITIRRKFVDPQRASTNEPSKQVYIDSRHVRHNELVALQEKNKQLELKNEALEEDLFNTEEEYKVAELRNKESFDNLHSNIDHLETTLKSLESKLIDEETEITALKKEKEIKDEIIQNINKGFNSKIRDLKVKLGVLEEFKTKKLREEKVALKKENKAKKKQRQKAKKEEKKLVMEVVGDYKATENNNVNTANDKTCTHPCEYCVFVANSRSELEEHAMKDHFEQLGKLAKKFLEYNAESLKLLENVPECEFILTPEEITHLGVDWKIHLEILEIINQTKT